MAAVRVVIADDQAMVRQGFGALLNAQSDIQVVGDAADGHEAVAVTVQARPDVVLMDVRMPNLDGLAATAAILARRLDPMPRVLMLTTFDLDDYVYEALRVGASGFMLKDAQAEELVRAVRVIAAGDSLLAPSITKRLIEEVTRRRPVTHRSNRLLGHLTPREAEVLAWVAAGKSNAEIAEGLFLAEQTVKTHVGKILMKLQLRDRVQAVVFAYENGVVRPG